MKIGIIIYSQTGNTYSVAKEIEAKLLLDKRDVTIEKIDLIDQTLPRKYPFVLNNIPSLDKYDVIIFGTYVEAFMLNPVMISYLNQLSNIKNKKVYCFVTQFFPYPWMGGNNAVKKMVKILNEKGALIQLTDVINWKNKNRFIKISSLTDKIARSLSKNN